MKKTPARVAQRLLGMKLSLSIPLVVRKEKLGVLGIIWKKDSFTDFDREVLSTFANQIAIAIYNARLFTQTQTQVKQLDNKAKDLQALLDISSVSISKLKSANALQEIMNAIPDKFGYLGYKGGGFLKYSSKKKEVHLVSVTGGTVIEALKKIMGNDYDTIHKDITEDDSDLLAKAVEDQNFVKFEKVSDFLASKRMKRSLVDRIQKTIGVKSGLIVPIMLREKLEGVLVLGNEQEVSKITTRDEEIMRTFANNLSLTFENTQLYKQVKNRLAEVKEANERLKLLDEAKTNFVSITSHQLRTPIAGVKGYLSMLLEGDFGEMTQEQKEIMRFNLANIERLVKLIDLFLDVSKIEAGKLRLDKEECDLSAIIKSVMQEFSNQIAVKKKLKVIYDKPSEKSNVTCDSERIRHVISNLVDNAIKYTPEGKIEISLEVKDDREIIKIKDNGIGVSKKEAPRLFDKFVRAEGGYRNNANGSGLGLYIVKRIVEGHGGKVWVESPGEGKGATFYVEILKKASKKYGEIKGYSPEEKDKNTK